MQTRRNLIRWFHHIATRDYFPALSARVRKGCSGSLGVLLLAFAMAVLCGLLLHPRVFALAGGIAAVIVLGVCWPRLSVSGLRASLRFDQKRVSENDSVIVEGSIANVLPWPAWGLIVRGGFGDVSVRLRTSPGRTESTWQWTFTPIQRGVYPTITPRIHSAFPFGMWEAKRALTDSEPLIVWPRTFPVGPIPTSMGAEMVEGNVSRNVVGSAGEILGVRPYRRGDSPRRVHWAQTARHDRLIVCELQSNSRPAVMIVLDAAAAVHTPGPNGSREWAIRIAASLAQGWLEAGSQVGLVCGDVVIPAASGTAQIIRLLDTLAQLPDDIPMTLDDALASTSLLRIAVTTDARSLPWNEGVRYAVLRREGFGGEPSSESGRAWVTFDEPDSVPHRLRYGWGEALHGS